MTAPAVVRRWNDPPVRVGRAAPDSGAGAGEGGRAAVSAVGAVGRQAARSAAVRARLADQLARMQRVGPVAAVLLSALVLHAGVVPHLAVRGATPDVLLAAVVAVAATGGSRAGAGFGFAAGLGADVFLATPLGTSALAYTLVGHFLGGSTGPRRARSAAALCRPGSTCFSCRTGRHVAGAGSKDSPSPDATAGPSRARRRIAVRRAALRRSMVLTVLGVGAGRLTAAAVATSLGGAAFPGASGLAGMAAVAVLSAPLGPPAAAALRRLAGRQGDAP